jgi:hypothetical protein
LYNGYKGSGNANNQSVYPRNTGVEYQAGVGTLSGATLFNPPQTETAAAVAATGSYNGPLSSMQFGGEPFGYWLGLILILIVLKFFSESPKTSINPAKIEVGGYNWLTIGIISVTFISIFKVLVNKFPLPGLTELGNAL